MGAVAALVGGLERWGYISVDRDPHLGATRTTSGFGTARGVKPQTVIRPSMTGTLARGIWEPLTSEIETRWTERLGKRSVDDLREALTAVHDRVEMAMPRFLPVLNTKGLDAGPVVELRQGERTHERELPALLSRVLLAFTVDYERNSEVSLPIAANVLRVLGSEPRALGELPLAAGVSKEAVSMSMTWLNGHGYIRVEPDPNGRGKVVAITGNGAIAQNHHVRRLADVEADWVTRFGSMAVESLRACLEVTLESASVSVGLVTPAGGWRSTGRYKPLTAAFVERPRESLPYSPMVLHRGGWPDGS
jgi:DNA-binding MarR family transcriptional regulator